MNLLSRTSYLTAALGLACLSAKADVLTTVGQTMPMIHINLEYNSFADTFSVHVDSGMPEMTPLSILSPGDSFDPAAPWYGTLDPSQAGDAWTRRYGFVNTGDALPVDLFYWINLDLSGSGMDGYYYAATPATFTAMFGTDGSSTLWQYPGAMYHPVFATAAAVDSFTVSGTVYMGDSSGNPDSGYDAESFSLSFTSVPEPQTHAFLLGVLILGLGFIRRKHCK